MNYINKSDKIIELELTVRQRILSHFKNIGITRYNHSSNRHSLTKKKIRKFHAQQREERLQQEIPFLQKYTQKLLTYFAGGKEISITQIRPKLIPVEFGSTMGNLFRFSTLLWSIPVSRGFGRRLRYVVIDQYNNKLIGLFALGDPVFNLKVRDLWIGWGVRDREERLVNVMDAYVLGAVPPYSFLIGGKLVASLIGSKNVSNFFKIKYGKKQGIISGKVKKARLALVTTTSALGRSSLYNRLKIPGILEYKKLGTTEGYGHFHITDDIFEDLRKILELDGHKYAAGHRYGDGPNWKFRVVRAGLQRIGLDPDLLRHGIKREVYGIPLAVNWREYLQGKEKKLNIQQRSTEEISEYCLNRWIIPRSKRISVYKRWKRDNILQQIIINTSLSIHAFNLIK